MKHFILFILLVGVSFPVLPAENQKLPPIASLKELPVTLASDFTGHEEIASPALPVITRDGNIFFFDKKLRQVFKTHIDNQALIPISRKGEGPKEYMFVIHMLIQDGFLYLSDSPGKLLCFGLNGEFKWEERTNFNLARIVAKSGDIFYLSKTSEFTKDAAYIGIYEWKKGEKERLLNQLPMLTLICDSIINGKRTSGAGYIYIANPVFSLCKDTIIAAGSKEFTFNLLDLKGNLKKTVAVEAPEPEPNKHLKSLPGKTGDIYPIMDIFCDPPYIIIISNYFKEGKPRVDFFTMEGKLKKSFLMPVEVDSQSSIMSANTRVAAVSNSYLLYTDTQEIGFKVYRIKVE
jgi:hypothetical protein